MKRNTGICGLLLASALVLTGCGGEAESEPSEPASAASASSEAPAPTPTAAKTYTNEDLTALVSSLTDAQGQPLIVVPAAQLDQLLAQAKELQTTATITPESCSTFATESAQIPEGSAYAAGTSQSAAENTVTTVTVFAVPDPQAMADELAQGKEASAECANFQIQAQGRMLTGQVQPLDVTTIGEESIGTTVTQTLDTGETQTIMTVSGVQGTLAATAVKVGSAVPSEAQAELVKLVNDALAKGQEG
jgi:hypothetical protein